MRRTLKGSARRFRKFASSTRAAMVLRRSLNNAFRERSQHVIIHTAHHKVGTSWFICVLRGLAEEFGVPLIENDMSKLPKSRPAIFFQNNVLLKPQSLSNYRGSHMIRDPRDIVISGYHYHLWTKEKWAVTPIKNMSKNIENTWSLLPVNQIQNMSYQQYLNSLSFEEGVLAEMKRCSTTTIKQIAEWNYLDSNIFEFKYENIINNQEEFFRQLFYHYGFTQRAIEVSLKIAKKCSFEKRSNRKIGNIKNESHLRSGKLQQWKEEFSENHKDYFKNLHGYDLIRLGYEKDMNW